MINRLWKLIHSFYITFPSCWSKLSHFEKRTFAQPHLITWGPTRHEWSNQGKHYDLGHDGSKFKVYRILLIMNSRNKRGCVQYSTVRSKHFRRSAGSFFVLYATNRWQKQHLWSFGSDCYIEMVTRAECVRWHGISCMCCQIHRHSLMWRNSSIWLQLRWKRIQSSLWRHVLVHCLVVFII